MKFIITLLLLSTLSYGILIGSTKDDLRTKLLKIDITSTKVIEDTTEYGSNVLIEFEDGNTIIFHFNKEELCIEYDYYPTNNNSLMEEIIRLNKESIIITDKKWKIYDARGIHYTYLIYKDNGAFLLMSTSDNFDN